MESDQAGLAAAVGAAEVEGNLLVEVVGKPRERLRVEVEELGLGEVVMAECLLEMPQLHLLSDFDVTECLRQRQQIDLGESDFLQEASPIVVESDLAGLNYRLGQLDPSILPTNLPTNCSINPSDA